MSSSKFRIPALGAAIGTLVAATLLVTGAQAAPGCRVDYTVTNQWQGGFGAAVTITNTGDAITSWRLEWSFVPGQGITQLWNGAFTQTGVQVSVTNLGYNGVVPTGGTASFGFNGTWVASNPTPAMFTLNGTVCGTPVPTSSPSTSPSVTPTGSPSPSPSVTPSGPTSPPANYPNPGPVTGSTGAHDPAVVKASNGTYILVTTGNDLPIRTSRDRINWQNAGVVWPGGASWTTTYTNGSRNLWAPDISFRNGQFYLYYSASTFGSQRSAIFLATSATGAAGSWTHRGLVIESSGSVNYNAIDPNLVVDSAGQWWLSFGSFWTGIKAIRLDPVTGMRSTSDTAIRALAQRQTAGGAIEAPFIHRRGNFYYLFVAFDLCCRGATSTYRVMVGRSTSPTGPYTDRNSVAMTSGGGTQILAGHGSIHGPGHPAVLADNGQDVLFYHYYADNGAARLGINLLGWDTGGWPFVY